MTRDLQQRMTATLERLEGYRTLSPFSRGFYRFLKHQLDSCEATADDLRRGYILLLRIEARRHGGVADAVNEGLLSVFSLLRTSRDTRQHVGSLLRALSGVYCSCPEEEAVWQLLVAECHYHLGETQFVVAALQRAIEVGCDQPLVHFALGYNYYSHALQTYTKVDAEKRQAVALDPERFCATCRQAITAFAAGLRGGPFDAQLHWWIGFMHETLDERDAAEAAYRRAAVIAPDAFAEAVEERLARLRSDDALAEDDTAVDEAQVAPITDEEIEEARRFLDQHGEFPDAFKLDNDT